MSEGATGELGRALLSKKSVCSTNDWVCSCRACRNIGRGEMGGVFHGRYAVERGSNAVARYRSVRRAGVVARMLDRGNGEGDMWAAWEGGGWRWKGLVARAGDCGRQTRDERRETRDPVRIAL